MKKVLIAVVFLSLVVGVVSFLLFKNERSNRLIAERNLTASTKQYRDDLGRTVTETQELRLSVSDFKKIVKQDSIYMNDYEKKLAHANEIIKSQDKKIRSVESVNSILMQSFGSNQIIYRINDTCKLVSLAPVHSAFFDASFKIINDSALVMEHTYHTGIDIIIDRERARDTDGSKRFLFCRLIFPRWVYSSSVVAEDPDARITSNLFIRFKK
jgi:hypothetical protein